MFLLGNVALALAVIGVERQCRFQSYGALNCVVLVVDKAANSHDVGTQSAARTAEDEPLVERVVLPDAVVAHVRLQQDVIVLIELHGDELQQHLHAASVLPRWYWRRCRGKHDPDQMWLYCEQHGLTRFSNFASHGLAVNGVGRDASGLQRSGTSAAIVVE